MYNLYDCDLMFSVYLLLSTTVSLLIELTTWKMKWNLSHNKSKFSFHKRKMDKETHKWNLVLCISLLSLFWASCPSSSLHLSIHKSTHTGVQLRGGCWEITSAKVCRLGNTNPHPDRQRLNTLCCAFKQYTPVVSCYDWWRLLLLGQYHTAEVIRELEPSGETIHKIWDCRNALCENLCSYKGTFQPPRPAPCGPITARETFSEKQP